MTPTEPAATYSTTWFEVFLDPFPPAWTDLQAAFLKRQLALPGFARVLDVCAGSGRIAGPLAEAGYSVTAVDLNRAAIEAGRARWPGVSFVHGDMRDLSAHFGGFDAVLCIWQSFGYFDEAENRRVLAAMAGCLRPGGRLVLDLYHREYLATRPMASRRVVAGVSVESRAHLTGNRYAVELAYSSGGHDRFDWEVFTPPEMRAVALAAGLKPLLMVSEFSERIVPGPRLQSFQVVLERPVLG